MEMPSCFLAPFGKPATPLRDAGLLITAFDPPAILASLRLPHSGRTADEFATSVALLSSALKCNVSEGVFIGAGGDLNVRFGFPRAVEADCSAVL